MNSDDAPGLGRRLLGGGKHSGQRPLTIRRLWALKDLVNKGEPTEDLDIPLAPWRKGTITFALALAGFMVGIDQSIIEPALPTIVAQFSSLHDIGAYTSAYLIPQCVLQPVCNRLYSICSFSSVYLSSVLLFILGSIVCAVSESSPSFICGRALSGLGAVGLSVGGFRMLALMPAEKEQNVSMGAFSLILGSSVVIGPIIGGAITQSHLGWHWLFWINLPIIGLVLLLVIGVTYTGGPDLRGEKYGLKFWEKLKLLDWLGTSLLALTLVPLILALDFGQTYGWKNPRSVVMFAVFGVSLVLLLLHQRIAKEAIFERAILFNRSVWTTTGIFFCALSSVSVIILFLPFLFQVIKDLDPRTSGFLSFPLAGTLAISTFAFSIISTKIAYFNPLAICGTIIFLVSNVLFIAMKSNFSVAEVVGYEIVAGFGMGMAWLAEIIYPRAVLDKHQLATALGYSRMLQQIGAAVAVQISAVAFTTTLTHNLVGLSLTPDEVSSLKEGSGINSHLSPAAKVAVAKAYSKAIRIGLAPSLAWAGLALLFALALPWPRLNNSLNNSEQKNGRGSDNDNGSGIGDVALSVIVPSTETSSVKNDYSAVSGPERNLLVSRLSFDSLHMGDLYDENGRWTGVV
ncbi:MFS domain-containing protein [Trichoderma simmonsii]|uniref:MFS domain-containing protein n=1 Tax=Trichoderma simmonsii TaxID=1491479 RepID=A0A8G0L713_9HYPO|nr:MFS domain-containing protein [Trichoderma simmonsii]